MVELKSTLEWLEKKKVELGGYLSRVRNLDARDKIRSTLDLIDELIPAVKRIEYLAQKAEKGELTPDEDLELQKLQLAVSLTMLAVNDTINSAKKWAEASK